MNWITDNINELYRRMDKTAKVIDSLIDLVQLEGKNIKQTKEQYDTLLEAIKLLSKISEKDNERINILKRKINLLEKENIALRMEFLRMDNILMSMQKKMKG